MKCIKSPDGEKILRVSDDKAEVMVSMESWKFCPKREWKEKVRDLKTDKPNKKDDKKKRRKK